jgi:hypothetical protein
MSILTDESAEKTVDSEELTQSKEYINPDAQPLIPSLDISALLARLNAAKYKEAKQGIREFNRIKNNGTPHESDEAFKKVIALLRRLDGPTNQ